MGLIYYTLNGYRYRPVATTYGIVLQKAGKVKVAPGQIDLFGQQEHREGETRTNAAGHQEVLQGGRWHLQGQPQQQPQQQPQKQPQKQPQQQPQQQSNSVQPGHLADFVKLQRSLMMAIDNVKTPEQAEDYLEFVDAELQAIEEGDDSAYTEGPYLQMSQAIAGLHGDLLETMQSFLEEQQESLEFMLEENEFN